MSWHHDSSAVSMFPSSLSKDRVVLAWLVTLQNRFCIWESLELQVYMSDADG